MRQKLADIREEKGMTQVELSKKSGVCRTVISGIESGRVKSTTVATLEKISRALGKRVDEIFFA